MALETDYHEKYFILFDAQKKKRNNSIIYEDFQFDPVWDWLFDPAVAVQYDGGADSSDVSMVLSSFSGWIPGP